MAWLFTVLLTSAAHGGCGENFGEMLLPPPTARAWCERGSSFPWEATSATGSTADVEIFYVCAGDPAAPAIYLNHGWPTSSFDFAALLDELATDHRVCALDTPGYGFSDKPDGFSYSILDDAALVEHFVRDIAGFESFVLLTHDKGDSVGLELLHRYQAASDPGYQITHHVMLNGSIHLPSAEISSFQQALLDDLTGPMLEELLTGPRLAALLGVSVYTPRLDWEEGRALASTFDYQDGTGVLHDTIGYLDERAAFEETRWLAALEASDVPTTLIWGELDAIAVPAVADHVWEEVLLPRGDASYWRVPCGDHYLQGPWSVEIADIVREELYGTPAPLAARDGCAAPYLHATTP